MIQQAYLVLKPSVIEGYNKEEENIKNIHVFIILKDSNVDMWYLKENIPLCGNNDIALANFFIQKASKLYINEANIKDNSWLVPNKNVLRSTLANLQNSGKEVCGQCVTTLYTDDDC